MSKMNEAITIIWDSCKGKERCPKKIIEGQINWLLKEQRNQLETECLQKLAKVSDLKADEIARNIGGDYYAVRHWLQEQFGDWQGQELWDELKAFVAKGQS